MKHTPFAERLMQWAANDSDVAEALATIRRPWDLLAAGSLNEAEAAAETTLAKAAEFPLYGSDSQHSALLVLGHVDLRRGNIEDAESRMLASASIEEPSPSLSTFGPNMSLAYELIESKRASAVLNYLELCSKFWSTRRARRLLRDWKSAILRGETPDFGPNLHYGTGGCDYQVRGVDESS